MPSKQRIQEIFSASEVKHGLSLFNADELEAVEKLLIEKDGKLLIHCQIKDKYKVAKPEEIVRQLWIHRLLTEYGYPKERIDVERIIYFGSRVEPGAADIVVLHEDLKHYFILFETKRPQRTDGLEQLKGYCNAEGAPIAVWSNGKEMIRLHREEPNIFVEIPRIPKVSETLRDILTERWTLKWLEEHDELKQGKTTLKKIILDLEELVLGNAGVDPFEEIFKLIYAKLYDEWRGINNPGYQLEFFVGDRSPSQVKTAISNLLEGAKRTWSGVFEPLDKIELRGEHLKVCVSFLEKVKLFNSNLRIIDEAFEYLIPQVSKKLGGQFITGPFGSEFIVENYVTEGSYRYIRGQDVKEFFVVDTDNVYIPESDYRRLSKYALAEGDILISVVGTLGNVAVVDKTVPPAIFSCKSTLFRSTTINPFYLIAYLNCRFGRTLLQRKVRGAVQTGLNIGDLRSLPIFIAENSLQDHIGSLVLRAKEHFDRSKTLYSQAESLLMGELGLKDFKPKYELSYTASLSKAFAAHRIDAEYFQPAFDQIAEIVAGYKNGHASLLKCAESVRPDFDPGRNPDSTFRYVELADIDSSIGIIRSASQIKGEDAPSRARRILKKGDVIVSSVEGSLEKIALVDEEHEASLASTGFFQFRATRIRPEVLLVLAKSIVSQTQLKRECAGTILTAVPNDSLKRIIIPILPPAVQDNIAELVHRSHEARRTARDLLEEAKRKVEEAIEESSARSDTK